MPSNLTKVKVNYRRLFLYFSAVLLVFFLCVLVAECFLRIVWKNPYRQTPIGIDYPGFVRFQMPNFDTNYDIYDLYDTEPRSRFRTKDDGQVLNINVPSTKDEITYFYGGSTTECRYVNEGSRWPENIDGINAANWGVSGNNLIDSYYNFKYHLAIGSVPEYAVFMHAINDFSLRYIFDTDIYIQELGKARRSNVVQNASFLYITDLKKYIFSLWSLEATSVKSSIIESNAKNESKKLAFMSNSEFDFFLKNTIYPFLTNRSMVLQKIYDLSVVHKVKIIFVTQPHAYGNNFIPRKGLDLRKIAPVNNKYQLSFNQMGKVLDLINENTRSFAKSKNIMFVDASAKFENIDVSDLFYDEIHYTKSGSLTLSRVIATSRPWRSN